MDPQKLFVDESIEINASAADVWDALTCLESTRLWADNFVGPGGEIVSDWKLGSPVLWKDKDGVVIVEGSVTAADPYRLLRFTVFNALIKEKVLAGDEDGITYRLSAAGDKTLLHVLQGDFGVMADGAKYRDMSIEIWRRVLPRVKTAAEGTKIGG